mmetsp:Transcript_9261/g.17698  ORF Transcript_9261/g.17698 Transcript_9261/m.17698 type:complete len:151 (-) Transcript_9261:964-1416(-)
MYDPFIPAEVDSFLNPFRIASNFEALKKQRAYGYDFLNDCPASAPAKRMRWSEDTDRQLMLSQSTFSEMRLREARDREPATVGLRYSDSLPADVLIFTNSKTTDKNFSPNCTGSFPRSSMSTTGTQTLEDRYSMEPFDVDLLEMSDEDNY